ncbi:Mur ligase family protein [Parablautia sp. Marseille-Q6255]|uniref:Mur ligase family protein n=1 Tax=Parablautia sp. Marseille-Q6255 TaxID=3039593 RepID=UPI0024BD1003|nr:UDP-N-acetylmuramyl-tripeptide synthetase [Parablautia sp. Marseille-Q6255]
MITTEQIAGALADRGLLLEAQRGAAAAVTRLTCDSRQVCPGAMFICKGAAFRPEYLAEAARRGAASYISERALPEGRGLKLLLVSDIRKAMAAAAACYFGYAPGCPKLTGITGTKGKTTTAWYLKAMLDAWMHEEHRPETGLLSTIRNYDGNEWSDAVMTTPEPVELHEFLARTVKNRLLYTTMEVSSQALKYKRVRELRFQVGIFLNISEDHISPQEHEDFEDYFSAKLSMFRQCDTACVNLDSDHAQRILKAARKAGHVVTFGRHPHADLRCSNIRTGENGTSFTVSCATFTESFTLAMKGRFNIENAMAAIAAAYVYGVPVQCMKQALAQTRVPGRMETFASRDGKICGIVDFAHNRLSFEKLFDAVFQEYSSYKKIITVFGCPGGKALNRRRELGLLAGLFSDYVMITSDDPGKECPEKIAEEIRRYVEMTGCGCGFSQERKDAVALAVRKAAQYGEKTMILLLGKGCERYQKTGEGLQEYPTDAALMQEAIRTYEGFTFQEKCLIMEAS